MFNLTISESLTAIAFIILLAYAAQIVRYALKDDVIAFKAKALAFVCQWQAKRTCPKPEIVVADPLFFDPKTDPEWQHLYVPTYLRQGRVLSFEQN
jgi:hypothetical protein